MRVALPSDARDVLDGVEQHQRMSVQSTFQYLGFDVAKAAGKQWIVMVDGAHGDEP